MTTANDSVLVTAGSGTTIATHLAASKEHQVVMIAGPSGHIWGTRDTYVAYALPVSAVGASKLHFDFFLNAAGKAAKIHSLYFFSSLDVAATGVVAIRMDLSRTTAVGTGGTAFSTESTTVGTRNMSRLDPGMTALPAAVTMREAPAGGATQGVYLTSTYTMPEEASTSMGYMTQYQNMIPGGGLGADVGDLIVPDNSGLRMAQGPVVSVGFVGMFMLFSLA